MRFSNDKYSQKRDYVHLFLIRSKVAKARWSMTVITDGLFTETAAVEGFL